MQEGRALMGCAGLSLAPRLPSLLHRLPLPLQDLANVCAAFGRVQNGTLWSLPIYQVLQWSCSPHQLSAKTHCSSSRSLAIFHLASALFKLPDDTSQSYLQDKSLVLNERLLSVSIDAYQFEHETIKVQGPIPVFNLQDPCNVHAAVVCTLRTGWICISKLDH